MSGKAVISLTTFSYWPGHRARHSARPRHGPDRMATRLDWSPRAR